MAEFRRPRYVPMDLSFHGFSIAASYFRALAAILAAADSVTSSVTYWPASARSRFSTCASAVSSAMSEDFKILSARSSTLLFPSFSTVSRMVLPASSSAPSRASLMPAASPPSRTVLDTRSPTSPRIPAFAAIVDGFVKSFLAAVTRPPDRPISNAYAGACEMIPPNMPHFVCSDSRLLAAMKYRAFRSSSGETFSLL